MKRLDKRKKDKVLRMVHQGRSAPEIARDCKIKPSLAYYYVRTHDKKFKDLMGTFGPAKKVRAKDVPSVKKLKKADYLLAYQEQLGCREEREKAASKYEEIGKAICVLLREFRK